MSALSNQFRKLQKDYLYQLQKQQEETSGSGTAFEMEEKRTPSSSVVTDQFDNFGSYTQQELVVVHNLDGLAAEREAEINKIVQSVNDLAQVMQDLSTLVIDQVRLYRSWVNTDG